MEILGAVQGVGFRPFVYRLACELGLTGWVINDSRGVFIEVEGSGQALHSFCERLQSENPPRAVIQSIESEWLEPQGSTEFIIRRSEERGTKSVVMLPDVATCGECLAEILGPQNRRFRYPFTNCTNCGPRFTIIRSLPYDRPNTTMERFKMCTDCQREYEQPLDRRFHAQPNACPLCGPHPTLWNSEGQSVAERGEALSQSVAALRRGEILAVKGLGGFHLLVEASNEEAVRRLRQRKGRYEKPLALMVPTMEAARELGVIDAASEQLLTSAEAPIVLLPRHPSARVAASVAPDNPRLGIMLPYSPLHHLLLDELAVPVVATSGNLSDEPICIDNQEAFERLRPIADLFLVHDRPIQRHVDDSVVHLVAGSPQPLRRARGLAPMPILLERSLPVILAVGAHLKNTVALSVGDRVFLSQHIGDMETPQAYAAFEAVIADFLTIYEAVPVAVAHDLHPDYPSTRWAKEAVAGAAQGSCRQPQDWRQLLFGLPLLGVQHHHSHLAACLAEHRVEGSALGITWDGTGYGSDGTIWGGEFLLGDRRDFQRVARLRPILLPGGDAAVREPRRTALALLWDMYGEVALERDDLPPVASLAPPDRRLLASMLRTGFRSHRTTSAGRLFDAAAALLDLHQKVSFEGQAAMALEFIADSDVVDAYPFELQAVSIEAVPPTGDASSENILEVDWRPLVEALIDDSRRGSGASIMAARFHNALVEAMVAVATAIGEPRVVLSGGCFQNRLLTERTALRLRAAGLDVLIHRQVPANDGGISLGQIAVAAARLGATDAA